MNTIEQDLRRLNNIANMYNKTGGEMKEMWKQKWYELLKVISRRIDESKRLTTNTR